MFEFIKRLFGIKKKKLELKTDMTQEELLLAMVNYAAENNEAVFASIEKDGKITVETFKRD